MSSSKGSALPRGRSFLWLLFIAALAVRVAFVATRSDNLDFPDSRAYDSIARNWLAGEGFREDISSRPFGNAQGRLASRAPGYPVFLAACYWAGLQRPQGIYLVQAFADAAMCVFLALLGRKLYGATVGAVAGSIAALYPFFIYFTGLLLAETLFTLGMVGFIMVLADRMDGVDEPARRLLWISVAGGALAGLLCLLRSSFLLFPFFVLPFWLAVKGWRWRAVAAWAGMIVVMALVVLPWAVRNYRIFRHFIPTTLQVGESLYEANSPYADGGPAMDRIDWKTERGGVEMNEYEENEFFKNAALQYIRERPGRFFALAVEKFRRFWNVVPNYAPFRSPCYAAVSVCVSVPILILAFLGILRPPPAPTGERRRQTSVRLLLLSPILYFTLMHMVFVGSVRYRTPIMPFVILLAAAGAEAAWSRCCARPVRRQ